MPQNYAMQQQGGDRLTQKDSLVPVCNHATHEDVLNSLLDMLLNLRQRWCLHSFLVATQMTKASLSCVTMMKIPWPACSLAISHRQVNHDVLDSLSPAGYRPTLLLN